MFYFVALHFFVKEKRMEGHYYGRGMAAREKRVILFFITHFISYFCALLTLLFCASK
jgi:hypothetical protein